MSENKWLKFLEYFFGLGAFLIPDIIEVIRAPVVGAIIAAAQFGLMGLILLAISKWPCKSDIHTGVGLLCCMFGTSLFLPALFEFIKGDSYIGGAMIGIMFSMGISMSITSDKAYSLKIKNKCQICRKNEKSCPEIPYCEECFKISFEKTQALIDEAEQRISLANKLGLIKQVEGVKKWFIQQSLPEAVRWILEKQKIVQQKEIINQLREHFPSARLFDSSGFDKFPIDSDRPDLNIPKEGLELLVRMRRGETVLLSNENLKQRR